MNKKELCGKRQKVSDTHVPVITAAKPTEPTALIETTTTERRPDCE